MADWEAVGRIQRPRREFVALAGEWCANQSARLLTYVWQAYDALQANLPSAVDPKDLERSITQLLEPRIHQAMTGDEPFYVQHGRYEHETKKAPPAQPPQYDIAFVVRADEKIMWPLEAKVLKSDGAVNGYVADVNDQFLTCRYAPFASEAAMLGYLLSGNPETAFRNIAERIPCTLRGHKSFRNRPHRISRHLRNTPAEKLYPRRFTCHHLLLQFPTLSAQTT